MSITANDNRRSYSGDGQSTAFALAIPFLANTDLAVILRAADGTETRQVLGTDYAVSGAGNPAGGTVTFGTAPASGVTVVIYRDVPLTQPMSLQDGGPLPAATANGGFDRLTMITQRLFERVTRGINLRETDTPGSGRLDAGGNEIADIADGTQPTSAASVQQLLAVTPQLDAYAAAAAGSAAAADASATAASVAAGSASGSASAADASAGAASASASAAGASAAEADSSAADAAASAAQSRINWKGQWLTATAYDIGDAVQNGGSSYFCIAAHTAGSTTQPGVGASWQTAWSLMASKGAAGAGTGDMQSATYDPNGHAADAFNRANHTGTQAISTVSGLQGALDGKASTAAVGMFSQLDESVKTANYTVTVADAGTALICNSSSARTFTLPSASSANQDVYFFRNIGTGDLTLDGNGSEQIEGATTLVLHQGCAAMLWSNGTAWRAFEVLRPATAAEAQAGTATGVYVDPVGLKAAVGPLSPKPGLWVRDEKASGTSGGASTTSYAARALNTVKVNTISGASLSSNRVTLPAGTYYAEWRSPTNSGGNAQSALYNATAGSYIEYGSSTFCGTTTSAIGESVGAAAFTLGSSAGVELHQRTSSVNANGLGVAAAFGNIEVYGELKIWKAG